MRAGDERSRWDGSRLPQDMKFESNSHWLSADITEVAATYNLCTRTCTLKCANIGNDFTEAMRMPSSENGTAIRLDIYGRFVRAWRPRHDESPKAKPSWNGCDRGGHSKLAEAHRTGILQ